MLNSIGELKQNEKKNEWMSYKINDKRKKLNNLSKKKKKIYIPWTKYLTHQSWLYTVGQTVPLLPAILLEDVPEIEMN